MTLSKSLFSLLFILFVVFSIVNGDIYPQKHTVPACRAKVSSYCARSGCKVWYVSPTLGNDTTGAGTKTSPWRTINNVIATKINATIARGNNQFYRTPGPIQGGDVIVLMAGSYPKLEISRTINDLQITITKEPGTNVVVDTVVVVGSSKFSLVCLNITMSTPNTGLVVEVSRSTFFAVSTDIRILNNTISSFQFLETDDQDKINSQAGTAIQLGGQYNEATGNYIYNVRRGVVVFGDYMICSFNFINYIFGDGFRVLHNHTQIHFNLVTNSMNVDGGSDHRDGLQMFTNGNQFSLFNITIKNNKFFSTADPDRPYADHFQGITGFDVLLDGAVVANNVIASATYHGIALFSTINSQVIANTLVDPTGSTQIKIWVSFSNKGGRPISRNNTVINNIMEATSSWSSTNVVLNTGNVIQQLTLAQQARFFANINGTDYRLKTVNDSPFVEKGNNTVESIYSPFDITGKRRATPYDIGAYNRKYV